LISLQPTILLLSPSAVPVWFAGVVDTSFSE